MKTIVLKFGGQATASPERIQEIAKKVVEEKERGFNVVVATAAMGRTKKDLISMAKTLSDDASKRELDVLVATSSQVTSALFALAL